MNASNITRLIECIFFRGYKKGERLDVDFTVLLLNLDYRYYDSIPQ